MARRSYYIVIWRDCIGYSRIPQLRYGVTQFSFAVSQEDEAGHNDDGTWEDDDSSDDDSDYSPGSDY